MDSRAKRRKSQNQQKKTMNDCAQESGSWQQHRAFGGLDWASQTHTVMVVDQAGKVIEDMKPRINIHKFIDLVRLGTKDLFKENLCIPAPFLELWTDGRKKVQIFDFVDLRFDLVDCGRITEILIHSH
jgi:hypothetical protein